MALPSGPPLDPNGTADPTPGHSAEKGRLPILALLLMASSGFIVVMTLSMPAGLLPQLAQGFSISQAAAGQLVSATALGSLLFAIPGNALSRAMRRKPLLISTLVGFLVVNTVMATTENFMVALGARFAAGAFSGLVWGMLAGYARRISPPGLGGRALAIVLTGTPVALAIGTPLGAFLGTTMGWRWTFATVSALTALILLLVMMFVPDAPGQQRQNRTPITRILAIPGVAPLFTVILMWILAHNLLFTYIAPYLDEIRVPLRIDVALFIFGAATLPGIWLSGLFVDRLLRGMTLTAIVAFIAAGLLFLALPGSLLACILAFAIWGMAYGGAAVQLQSAMAVLAGDNVEVGTAMVSTSFNVAMFVGVALGALLLEEFGATMLPLAFVALSAAALVIVLFGPTRAFAGRA